ncbi:hypothetical protein JRO89_XS04G0291600 [Xanthoceras sorbifolium]|uniref:Uncharacterized protein n=1 Tax=Xanthoceras sorbifolium TaxID=99658 RepID=A0ABQ8I8R4_9ROSI|nr:hypothetical protein JRO89_XS04G0291600 [Xanthoceras sorbifolium]
MEDTFSRPLRLSPSSSELDKDDFLHLDLTGGSRLSPLTIRKKLSLPLTIGRGRGGYLHWHWRSAEDANRTFSSLELPRVVSVASGPSTPISVGESPLKENQERINGYESPSISQYNGRQRQKAHDPARDISIHIFDSQSAEDDPNKASNDAEKVTDEIAVASDPLEFDKLTLVWGKPRQPPLGSEEVGECKEGQMELLYWA